MMKNRNEGANFARYDPPAGRSKPEYGMPGMHPDCFLLLEKNLKSMDGPSGMMNVFDYLLVSFCLAASCGSEVAMKCYKAM